MKKAFLYLFIGLSLVGMLVEMFTGWLIKLPSPSHSRCLGTGIYDFYRLSYGKGVVERRIS